MVASPEVSCTVTVVEDRTRLSTSAGEEAFTKKETGITPSVVMETEIVCELVALETSVFFTSSAVLSGKTCASVEDNVVCELLSTLGVSLDKIFTDSTSDDNCGKTDTNKFDSEDEDNPVATVESGDGENVRDDSVKNEVAKFSESVLSSLVNVLSSNSSSAVEAKEGSKSETTKQLEVITA